MDPRSFESLIPMLSTHKNLVKQSHSILNLIEDED